jgi:hypothetical protein
MPERWNTTYRSPIQLEGAPCCLKQHIDGNGFPQVNRRSQYQLRKGLILVYRLQTFQVMWITFAPLTTGTTPVARGASYDCATGTHSLAKIISRLCEKYGGLTASTHQYLDGSIWEFVGKLRQLLFLHNIGAFLCKRIKQS